MYCFISEWLPDCKWGWDKYDCISIISPPIHPNKSTVTQEWEKHYWWFTEVSRKFNAALVSHLKLGVRLWCLIHRSVNLLLLQKSKIESYWSSTCSAVLPIKLPLLLRDLTLDVCSCSDISGIRAKNGSKSFCCCCCCWNQLVVQWGLKEPGST